MYLITRDSGRSACLKIPAGEYEISIAFESPDKVGARLELTRANIRVYKNDLDVSQEFWDDYRDRYACEVPATFETIVDVVNHITR